MARIAKKPVRYSKALGERICARLAQGEPLKQICRGPDMPDESAVRYWAIDNVEFAPLYARAREVGYDKLAEEILKIADTPKEGQIVSIKEWGAEVTTKDMIEHRRLQIDTRKWLLAKMLPKRYGDASKNENDDKDAGTFTVVGLLPE